MVIAGLLSIVAVFIFVVFQYTTAAEVTTAVGAVSGLCRPRCHQVWTRRVLRPSGVLAASVPVTGTDQSVWTLIDRVVDCHLPPAPKAVDDSATRATIGDPDAFRSAALAAGFSSASVEVVDEEVHWESAEMLVARCMSWWQFASRIDALDSSVGETFMADATEAVRREHPGAITTHSRNLVLTAHRT